MHKTGLILLPNSLDPNNIDIGFFPANLPSVVRSLDGIFVEDEKNARRYLLQFMDREEMQKITMKRLYKYTEKEELLEFIDLIKNGKKFGILSEAGMPCIADPGSKLVELANSNSIPITSISGPCSILMGLMLSGFSAQKFMFHGYLPRKIELLKRELIQIEKRSQEDSSTHIWIEPPYKSDKMLQICIDTLYSTTSLCVAMNLTAENEKVYSFPIFEWKNKKIVLGKNPCVFLLAAKALKK